MGCEDWRLRFLVRSNRNVCSSIRGEDVMK